MNGAKCRSVGNDQLLENTANLPMFFDVSTHIGLALQYHNRKIKGPEWRTD